MPKKQTTVTTPNKRPDRLGAELNLESVADVDAALEELAWCGQRLVHVDTELRELHDAIDRKREKLLLLSIGDVEVNVPERRRELDEALLAWTGEHLREHLTGEEKSLSLAHGSLHVRKLELSIGPQEGLDDKAVLERIEKLTTSAGKTSGLLTATRKIVTKIFSAMTKLLLGDLIKVTITLNREGLVAAYKAKQLDDKTLKSLGLVADDTRERFAVKVL